MMLDTRPISLLKNAKEGHLMEGRSRDAGERHDLQLGLLHQWLLGAEAMFHAKGQTDLRLLVRMIMRRPGGGGCRAYRRMSVWAYSFGRHPWHLPGGP